jgi:hypothetical protein
VFAKLACVPLYLHEQALVFGPDIEVGKYADRNKDRQYNTEGQFKADLAIEHKSPVVVPPIDASHPTFSLATKDTGTGMHPVPRNTAKAGTRDLLSQKYLYR